MAAVLVVALCLELNDSEFLFQRWSIFSRSQRLRVDERSEDFYIGCDVFFSRKVGLSFGFAWFDV